MVATAASLLRLRTAYLVWVIAGFCLIANGAYIGFGTIRPIGDAEELIAHGMPRGPMAAFGLLAFAGGFWIWDRISPRFGFGTAPAEISAWHAYVIFGIAALLTAGGLVFGDRGV